MVMTGYAMMLVSTVFCPWRNRGYGERTSLSSDLLACAADIAEQEGVDRGIFDVYSRVEGCVYTVFAALFAHMGEGGVVSW